MSAKPTSKRVLFLNPPNKPFTERALLIEPIDLLSLATFVRTLGVDVLVRDLDAEQICVSAALPIIETARPDVVVIPFDYHIPLFTNEAMSGVCELCQMAAEMGARVVTGGKPARSFPDFFVPNSHCVAVTGEMEPALTELLMLASWMPASLREIAGIVYRNESGDLEVSPSRKVAFDLASLPFPDRKLLPLSNYIDVRSML